MISRPILRELTSQANQKAKRLTRYNLTGQRGVLAGKVGDTHFLMRGTFENGGFSVRHAYLASSAIVCSLIEKLHVFVTEELIELCLAGLVNPDELDIKMNDGIKYASNQSYLFAKLYAECPGDVSFFDPRIKAKLMAETSARLVVGLINIDEANSEVFEALTQNSCATALTA
jgi:hypothetical protein